MKISKHFHNGSVMASMMSEICIIIGTRPEVIKMSPVVRACEGSGRGWFRIHTGQGCSCDVDRVFFGLPDAKYNL